MSIVKQTPKTSRVTCLNLSFKSKYMSNSLKATVNALPLASQIQMLNIFIGRNNLYTYKEMKPLILYILSCSNLLTLTIHQDHASNILFLQTLLGNGPRRFKKLRNLSVNCEHFDMNAPNNITISPLMLQYPFLVSLELKTCYFSMARQDVVWTNEQIEDFKHVFQQMTHLKQLTFSTKGNTGCTAKIILAMFDSLKSSRNLTHVTLGLDDLRSVFNDEDMGQLYNKIQLWRETLQSFHLKLRKFDRTPVPMFPLTDISFIKYADTIASFKKLQELKFDITNISNNFRNNTLDYFLEKSLGKCKALKKFSVTCRYESWTRFNSRENGAIALVLTDAILITMANPIKKLKHLQEFELIWPSSSSVSDIGLKSLFEALAACKKMRKFHFHSISDNVAVTVGTMEKLYSCFEKLEQLSSFNLRLRNNLTDLGLYWLAKLFRTKTQLQDINIHCWCPQETPLSSDVGIKELFHSLSFCKKLKNIELNFWSEGTNTTDDILKCIRSCLVKLELLEKLDLQLYCVDATEKSNLSIHKVKDLLRFIANMKKLKVIKFNVKVREDEVWDETVLYNEVVGMFWKGLNDWEDCVIEIWEGDENRVRGITVEERRFIEIE